MSIMKALGLVETSGLTAAIAAADAAVKSANVELLGYENTRGAGMITVKVLGDVGAVKAAVEAAKVVGGQVGRVVSTQVIARPHNEIEALIGAITRGKRSPEAAPPAAPAPKEAAPAPKEPELKEPAAKSVQAPAPAPAPAKPGKDKGSK